MGVVYEAEQITLGRSVALKVLPFASVMDQKAITRFKTEARAAGTLDHPNIVPVHSVGNERGVYYYAMALVSGLSLTEVIQQLRREILDDSVDNGDFTIHGIVSDGSDSKAGEAHQSSGYDETIDAPASAVPAARKSNDASRENAAQDTQRDLRASISTHRSRFGKIFFQNAAQLGREAAEALEHAHQRGIVHRDIKPGNLLIDMESKLWVTDFGLARIESDAGMTMTGDIVGTLRYMAPEQALAKRVVVDHRADIYSLGVALYELLTLRTPFDALDREALLKQIAFDEPKPVRYYNPAVPKDLQTIVQKAIAKNPDERYNSAREMADDLEAYLNNRPIAAKPPSLAQRSAKWVARHKGLTIATAVLLVLTSIGLSFSTWLIAMERNDAVAAKNEAVAAKNEALEAKDDANNQKRTAEENFRLAREAVDTYLTKVSEEQLLNVPTLQPLRKELLGLALEYYHNFVAKHGEDDDVREALAAAYDRIGTVTSEIGSKDDALNAHRTALQMREQILADQPKDEVTRRGIAESHWKIGKLLYELQQRNKATAALQESISAWQALTDSFPDESLYWFGLARAYQQLSENLNWLSKQEASSAASKEAVKSLRKLVNKQPQNTTFRFELAKSLYWATLHPRTDRSEKKLICEEAIQLASSLSQEYPNVSKYADILALCYQSKAGHVLSEANAQVELINKAIAVHEKVVQRDPLVASYSYHFALTLHIGAQWNSQVGQMDLARKQVNRQIEICENLARDNPGVAAYRYCLASGHLALGEMESKAHLRSAKEKALEHCQNAVAILEKAIIPGEGAYRFRLESALRSVGNLQNGLGKPNDALVSFQRAWDESSTIFQMDRGHAKGLWKSCQLLDRQHKAVGSPGEMLQEYERLLKVLIPLHRKPPNEWPTYPLLWETYRVLGSSFPDHPQNAFWRANALKNAELFVKALQDFNHNHKDLGHFLDKLAREYVANGQRDKAVETWQSIFDSQSNNHGLLNEAAWALVDKPGKDSSFSHAEQALQWARMAWDIQQIAAFTITLDVMTGNLWCVCTNGPGKDVVIFDRAGNELAVFPHCRARDIAYDPSTDSFWLVGPEILNLDRNGNVRFKSSLAGKGWSYIHVATNQNDGSVWVVECAAKPLWKSNNRLWLFNADGSVRHKFQLSGPALVKSCLPNGDVLVVTWKESIQRATPDGKLHKWSSLQPTSIVTPRGGESVWITTDDGLVRLDRNGNVKSLTPLKTPSLIVAD